MDEEEKIGKGTANIPPDVKRNGQANNTTDNRNRKQFKKRRDFSSSSLTIRFPFVLSSFFDKEIFFLATSTDSPLVL